MTAAQFQRWDRVATLLAAIKVVIISIIIIIIIIVVVVVIVVIVVSIEIILLMQAIITFRANLICPRNDRLPDCPGLVYIYSISECVCDDYYLIFVCHCLFILFYHVCDHFSKVQQKYSK